MITLKFIILLILGLIIVLPIVAYLVIKWGAVGFFQGKEAFKRRIDTTTIHDKKRKHENF